MANFAAASAASALAVASASAMFSNCLVRASNLATAAAYTAASASSTNFHARNNSATFASAAARASAAVPEPLSCNTSGPSSRSRPFFARAAASPTAARSLAVPPSAGRSSAVLRRLTDSTYLFATPTTAKSSPATRATAAAISSFVGTWFPSPDPSSPPHGIPLRRLVWHPRTHAK